MIEGRLQKDPNQVPRVITRAVASSGIARSETERWIVRARRDGSRDERAEERFIRIS